MLLMSRRYALLYAADYAADFAIRAIFPPITDADYTFTTMLRRIRARVRRAAGHPLRR